MISALRPHQWIKNLFVFGPLLFTGRWAAGADLWAVAQVFGAWCAAASAVYLFNDLRDREADRLHPIKRHRAIAAGRLSPPLAAGLALLLAGLGLGWLGWTDPGGAALLGAYLGLNLGYSLGLKRVVVLDLLIVAAGFVLRVLAGAWALRVPASPWLLVCTGLLATFLAATKRRQELAQRAEGAETRAVLQAYTLPALDQAQTLLAGATLLAYCAYCASPTTVGRLGDGRMLLTAPPVLYGLLRFLWLGHSRGLGEDPSKVALGDPGLIAALLIWAGTAALLISVGPGP